MGAGCAEVIGGSRRARLVLGVLCTEEGHSVHRVWCDNWNATDLGYSKTLLNRQSVGSPIYASCPSSSSCVKMSTIQASLPSCSSW